MIVAGVVAWGLDKGRVREPEDDWVRRGTTREWGLAAVALTRLLPTIAGNVRGS